MCSDRPDQNVSDPDRLYVYHIFLSPPFFLRSAEDEIKPLSFHQSTHLVDFTLFRAATLGKNAFQAQSLTTNIVPLLLHNTTH